MRKILYITLTFISIGFIFWSCQDDFLEKPPLDEIDAGAFFNTANDLEAYTNGFYHFFDDFGVTGAHDDDSDNIIPLNPLEQVRGTRLVPVSKGSGGWRWTQLRSINFFLENYHKCDDNQAKLKYSGIARFFRANFYYNKVKRFGDVPWYNKVLSASDDDLYKPRDSRILVMDSVLADLNYAIDNIPAEVSLNRITKYTALILKARICLFEGTFRKYHDIEGYEKFLNEAFSASNSLIESNAYTLFSDGGPDIAYRELFARNNQTPEETILAQDYDFELKRHNIGYLMTAPTMGGFGLNKDLVNSYLMKDGSKFTDISNYQHLGFFDEMQNRDPRLTQTTAGPQFIAYGESEPEPIDISFSTTGYRVIKALPSKDQWSNKTAYNDQIIFRFAEALLIYAESKAELNDITQNDLDKSINRLRSRVSMPPLNLSTANSNPDPYLDEMYPNVKEGANKGVILEIRRERRIELVGEALRWDDLMRWKEGKKLEKPMLGIYFPGLGAYDFNNDGKTDVYLHDGDTSGIPSGTGNIIDIRRKFLTDGIKGNLDPFEENGVFDENKDYYYPIPLEDLQLNKNLEQNPGWGNK